MEKLSVVNGSILGKQDKGSNLYFVLWQRIANSGFFLVWASSEEEAWERVFKVNTAVRHTIVKIDPNCMPVTDGRKAL